MDRISFRQSVVNALVFTWEEKIIITQEKHVLQVDCAQTVWKPNVILQ